MSDLSSLQFVTQTDAAPDTFNVLLFGSPKSGKSTAAATAPGPILWLNAEGSGALGFARKVAAERGNAIHEVAVPDGRQGTTPAQVLRLAVGHVRGGGQPVVRTVVVDTLGKMREALARELGGSKPTLPQWQQVNSLLTEFVSALRDLPVNVVFLAHTDQADDAEVGRTVKPLIGGKITEFVPGEVDVVAYTSSVHAEGVTRYVGQLVDGKGRTGLGDRSGAILQGQPYRDLDLTAWLTSYREGLTPADDPFTPEASTALDLEATG